VKALKQILILGIVAGFGAVGALADDDSGSLRTDVRTAIAIFQDQKADFLAQQRDEHKSRGRKLRDEVRVQVVAATKGLSSQARQELKESIQNAKSQAREQARKLLEESAEVAHSSHHAQ
jgi:hypothetical protein